MTGFIACIPGMAAYVGSDGTIIEVNAAWREVAQVHANGSADFVGWNYLAICERASGPTSEGASEVVRGLRNVLEGNVTEFSVTYPCHTENAYRWFKCFIKPLNSEDELAGAVVQHVDVTGEVTGHLTRASAITDRTAREQRIAAITETVPVQISYLDQDCVVQYVNAACARQLDLSPKRFVGLELRDVIGETSWAIVVDYVDAALLGTPQCFEAPLAYRTNFVTDARVTLIPDVAPGGIVVGLYKFDEDLTEFRERERHLQVARDAAEAANRSKSSFLANMSHELRTPLNAILGYTEIMKRQIFGTIGNERYADYLEDIHRSGTYLFQLLEDVLDLARLEAGGRDLVSERTDLLHVIRSAIAPLGQRGEKITVHGSEPRMVFADELALKQVLVNVLDNALKYGGDGGVEVNLACGEDGTISVLICDDGPGIAAEDLVHVTEPFYTGERPATVARPESSGTGVGLALSKRLIEGMGGKLKIDSELGEGTCVRISLAMAQEPA